MVTTRFAFSVLVVAFVAGCSGSPTSPPKEVVYAADTAEWSVVTGAKGDPIPDAVPIVTMLNGTRYEGLLLAPGTTGYARTLPNGIRQGEHEKTEITLPIVVESDRVSWKVVMLVRRFPSTTVEGATMAPFAMDIAVDPPGPERPVYRSIYREGVLAD